jgi:hypothetical protein
MAFNLYLHSLPWHSYWHSCSQSDVSAPGRYMYNCLCVQHSGAYSCRKYWPRVRHVRSNRTVCTNPALACATVIWLLTMVAHKILSAQVQAARARVALLSHTFAHITRVRDNITAQAAPPLLLIPPPASLDAGLGSGWRLRAVRPADSAQMQPPGLRQTLGTGDHTQAPTPLGQHGEHHHSQHRRESKLGIVVSGGTTRCETICTLFAYQTKKY